MTDTAYLVDAKRKLLASVTVLCGAMMLAACGGADEQKAKPKVASNIASDGPKVFLFENVFACDKQTKLGREKCGVMDGEALAIAEAEAPRFQALADCEARFAAGKCIAASGKAVEGGKPGYFLPFPTGFLWNDKAPRAVPVFAAADMGYQTVRGMRLTPAGEEGQFLAGKDVFKPVKGTPKIAAASENARKAGMGKREGWKLASQGEDEAKGKKKGKGKKKDG